MIEVEIVADSIGTHAPRLTTFKLTYPKFIHSEFMTHRQFSRNASSSRAIPVAKNLEEVRNDDLRATPVWWGCEQKGMSSGSELEGHTLSLAKFRWKEAALYAANYAEILSNIGAHKSIVNRILEPFLHIRVIATSTEPGLLNFFGLRLDCAAQPEIRVLAEKIWAAWNESKPMLLPLHAWHLPFISIEDKDQCNYELSRGSVGEVLSKLRQVSAARCARVSYLSFETGKRSTIEEDLRLFEKLALSSPKHLSPLEHQATPDDKVCSLLHRSKQDDESCLGNYCRPDLHGNLLGWQQFRKMILGESIAPLPEGYSR